MITLKLTEKEASSLQGFIEAHNQPCFDCDVYTDCRVRTKGNCIATNMQTVLKKVIEAQRE